MEEQYLEWLFLRNILGLVIDTDSYNCSQLSFNNSLYSLDKIKERYIELTKELLLEYEL